MQNGPLLRKQKHTLNFSEKCMVMEDMLIIAFLPNSTLNQHLTNVDGAVTLP